MSHCLCIGGLIVIADGAAWLLSAQTGDSRWVVLISALTTVVVALSTAIVMAAPHVGRALTAMSTTIYPALALIWKQREEINKGSYTAQIADLKKSLAENTRITEGAQTAAKTLGEEAKAAAQRHTDTIERMSAEHAEQTKLLMQQLTLATAELQEARLQIADLREHDNRLLTTMAVKQEHHGTAIDANKAAIQETKVVVDQTAAAVEQINVERSAERSGEMPAVDGGGTG